MKTFYGNFFLFERNPFLSSLVKLDPFWTDLIQKKNQTAIFILFVSVIISYTNIFRYFDIKKFFFDRQKDRRTEPWKNRHQSSNSSLDIIEIIVLKH